MKNEIRYVELMIALAEDKTLHNVLPACQEKHLLGLEIAENNAELLALRSRKDALSGKSTERATEVGFRKPGRSIGARQRFTDHPIR